MSDAENPSNDSGATPASGRDVTDQVREILANVGSQLDELTRLQMEHEAQAAELEQREANLRAAQEEFEAARLAFEGERAATSELIDGLAERERALAAGGTGTEVAGLQTKLEEIQSALTREERDHASTKRILEKLEAAQADSATPDADASRVAELECEVARLTAALAEQEMNNAGAETNEELAMAKADLRRKARRIATVAAHLKRRRDRLRFVREALRERDGADGTMPETESQRRERSIQGIEAAAAQMRRLDIVRQELSDRRAELADKEHRMHKRWARPRAVMMVGWMVFLAGVSGALSWFAADAIAPAVVAAQVTIEAKGRWTGVMPAEDSAQWQAWHANLVKDQGFRDRVLARTEERKIALFANPTAINTALDRDLSFDRTEAGKLVLTLQGTQRSAMRDFLDVVATTIAADSLAARKKRANAAWAEVRGEREERGRSVYATIKDAPIKDDRPLYAAGAYGIVLFLVSVLVVSMYRRLMRAKREFEGDEVNPDSVYSTA